MSEPVLEAVFAGGIDQSSREEIVDASRAFTLLENVRQTLRGGATKRPGYRELPNQRTDFGPRSSGARIFAHRGSPCVIDDDAELDYFSAPLEGSVHVGRVSEAACRLIGAPSVGGDALIDDAALVGGYLVLAHRVQDDDGVKHAFASVLDASTGAVVRGPERLYGGNDVNRSSVARLGSEECLFIVSDSSAEEIHAFVISLASFGDVESGWTHLGALAADYTTGLSVCPAGDRVAVAYATDLGGGSQRVRLKTVDSTGVVEATDWHVDYSQHMGRSVDVASGDGILWTAWGEEVSPDDYYVRVVGRDPSSLLTVIASQADVFHAGDVADLAVSVVDLPPGAGQLGGAVYASFDHRLHAQRIKVVAGAATIDGERTVVRNALLVGRPFVQGARIYAPFSSENSTELIVCECTPMATDFPERVFFRPVAAPIEREIFAGSGLRRSTPTNGSIAYHVFALRKTGASNGALIAELNFGSPHRWMHASYDSESLLSGGVLSVFDGVRAFEVGFHCAPTKPEVDTSASGLMTFSNGGRRYVAVYIDTDADGNVHTSGVSLPSEVTGNVTSKKVVATVEPLSLTGRGAIAEGRTIRIQLYGTTDGGEAPYHLVATAENVPNGNAIEIEDTEDDAILMSRPLLYGTGSLPGTNGAGQDRRAPPSCQAIVVYNGMLVAASGSSLRWSGQLVDGEGAWFSPVFQTPVGEEIVAIEEQDGTLYILAEGNVYAVAGEAPSDNGAVGGLGAIRRVASDVGCIEPRSVVATSVGIFFRSARGIELLTRSSAVEYVGEQVKGVVEAFPVVTSAVLDPKNALVRFTLATEDGSAGRSLVFSLITGAWESVDDVTGSSAHEAARSACVTSDGYAWLASDGTVRVEDASTHLDGDEWVKQAAETGWVHIAGIQGEQLIDRVLLLAERHTPHDLTISLAFDYADFTSSKTFAAAQLATLARQWLDREVVQATSQAVRVRLEDAAPPSDVGTGKGATWVCLTFSGQPHRAAKRTSGAQRGG